MEALRTVADHPCRGDNATCYPSIRRDLESVDSLTFTAAAPAFGSFTGTLAACQYCQIGSRSLLSSATSGSDLRPARQATPTSNGDGISDLLWRDSSPEKPCLAHGRALQTEQCAIVDRSGWNVSAVADFNGTTKATGLV
jgi:hypothetical protein